MTAAHRRRPRKNVETTDFIGFLRRIVRGMARRVQDGDLEALGDMARALEYAEDELAKSVAVLRSEPFCYSWAQIAEQLGITPQAAHKRYSRLETVGARRPGGQPANLR